MSSSTCDQFGFVPNYYIVERGAPSMLATLIHDQDDLRGLLIRMSFSDNTLSSGAVLRSILAISSLHQYGLQSHAAQLKIATLQTLSASVKAGISAKESLQHVATGMVLCSFEVRSREIGNATLCQLLILLILLKIEQAADSSGDWLPYACGVKDVIKHASSAANIGSSTKESDSVLLMAWVHYHDVLARFSIRHWRRHNTANKNSKYASLHHPQPTVCYSTEVCFFFNRVCIWILTIERLHVRHTGLMKSCICCRKYVWQLSSLYT